MAKFRIIGSHSTADPNIADFDVIYIEGNLIPGEKFTVYDTHHPIVCTITKSTSEGNVTTLRCNLYLGLGWENQFVDAIVDTEAKDRPAAFSYSVEDKYY
jgi:hypothetical protein